MAIALLGIFGIDFIYSTLHPNAGEGITSKVNKEALLIDNSIKEKKRLANINVR